MGRVLYFEYYLFCVLAYRLGIGEFLRLCHRGVIYEVVLCCFSM